MLCLPYRCDTTTGTCFEDVHRTRASATRSTPATSQHGRAAARSAPARTATTTTTASRATAPTASAATSPARAPASPATCPGRLGTCWPVDSGKPDPRGVCKDQGPPSCGHNGTCDGVGGCANYARDTQCLAAVLHRQPPQHGRDLRRARHLPAAGRPGLPPVPLRRRRLHEVAARPTTTATRATPASTASCGPKPPGRRLQRGRANAPATTASTASAARPPAPAPARAAPCRPRPAPASTVADGQRRSARHLPGQGRRRPAARTASATAPAAARPTRSAPSCADETCSERRLHAAVDLQLDRPVRRARLAPLRPLRLQRHAVLQRLRDQRPVQDAQHLRRDELVRAQGPGRRLLDDRASARAASPARRAYCCNARLHRRLPVVRARRARSAPAPTCPPARSIRPGICEDKGSTSCEHQRQVRRQRQLPAVRRGDACVGVDLPGRRRRPSPAPSTCDGAGKCVTPNAVLVLPLPAAARASARTPAPPTPTAPRRPSASTGRAASSRPGQACVTAAECLTGFCCAQGFCCTSACTGACQSCALANALGHLHQRRRTGPPIRRGPAAIRGSRAAAPTASATATAPAASTRAAPPARRRPAQRRSTLTTGRTCDGNGNCQAADDDQPARPTSATAPRPARRPAPATPTACRPTSAIRRPTSAATRSASASLHADAPTA